MNLTIILFLVLIGILSGFLSGMMGVGGGVIMVPLMVFLLGFTQHEAQGTSLAVLAVPVTFLAAYNYHTEEGLNWKYALVIAISFVIGGYIGSKLAVNISEILLKRIFGVIMLIVSIKLIFFK